MTKARKFLEQLTTMYAKFGSSPIRVSLNPSNIKRLYADLNITDEPMRWSDPKKEIRMLASGSDIYWWDAYNAVHNEAAESLGLYKDDCALGRCEIAYAYKTSDPKDGKVPAVIINGNFFSSKKAPGAEETARELFSDYQIINGRIFT